MLKFSEKWFMATVKSNHVVLKFKKGQSVFIKASNEYFSIIFYDNGYKLKHIAKKDAEGIFCIQKKPMEELYQVSLCGILSHIDRLTYFG